MLEIPASDYQVSVLEVASSLRIEVLAKMETSDSKAAQPPIRVNAN